MKINIKELADEVATLLGEATTADSFPADSPFPDIESRVRILAPVLLRTLISEMSVNLLPSESSISAYPVIDNKGVVTLTLPDDFLRLVSVKMSDWKYPVREISTDPRRLALQHSGPDGIRGNPYRPVVTFGIDNYGRRSLKMYSSNNESTVEHAYYVSVPKIDGSGMISYPDALHGELLDLLLRHFLEEIKTPLPQ